MFNVQHVVCISIRHWASVNIQITATAIVSIVAWYRVMFKFGIEL